MRGEEDEVKRAAACDIPMYTPGGGEGEGEGDFFTWRPLFMNINRHCKILNKTMGL
jgi:hypothetical protein